VTDVRIFQADDGGDIEWIAGQAVMDDGLESSVYLSLFGGNSDDSGLEADESREWWANKIEPDPQRHYRSETQFLLDTLPLVPANLIRFRDAVNRDIAWMTSTGLAQSIAVAVTIPALNTVLLAIQIVIDDAVYEYVFTAAARARLQQ
jgi:phage gp46-like protein